MTMGLSTDVLKAYIEERYDAEMATRYSDYLKYVQQEGIVSYENDHGFVTMKPEGDALIVYDMYILPEHRGQHKAWGLWNAVQEFAKSCNKRVIITFSEKAGKNHNLGLRAMQAVNFVKMFDTNIDSVYIRGV